MKDTWFLLAVIVATSAVTSSLTIWMAAPHDRPSQADVQADKSVDNYHTAVRQPRDTLAEGDSVLSIATGASDSSIVELQTGATTYSLKAEGSSGEFQLLKGTSPVLTTDGVSTQLNGDLTASGGLTVSSGDTVVQGLTATSMSATSGLTVSGATQLSGGATVVSGLTVSSGATQLSGGATVASGLTVSSGATQLSGGATIFGGLTLSGAFDATTSFQYASGTLTSGAPEVTIVELGANYVYLLLVTFRTAGTGANRVDLVLCNVRVSAFGGGGCSVIAQQHGSTGTDNEPSRTYNFEKTSGNMNVKVAVTTGNDKAVGWGVRMLGLVD